MRFNLTRHVQDGSVWLSIVALLALFAGFTGLGYVGMLLNKEKYMK